MQVLYSYLIGIQVAQNGPNQAGGGPLNLGGGAADNGGAFGANLANLIKVTQFKNTSQLSKVHFNQAPKTERQQ